MASCLIVETAFDGVSLIKLRWRERQRVPRTPQWPERLSSLELTAVRRVLSPTAGVGLLPVSQWGCGPLLRWKGCLGSDGALGQSHRTMLLCVASSAGHHMTDKTYRRKWPNMVSSPLKTSVFRLSVFNKTLALSHLI